MRPDDDYDSDDHHHRRLPRMVSDVPDRAPREGADRDHDHDRHQRGHRNDRDQRAEHEQQEQQENRSEEHTSELQSLMRNSYAVFCLKKKNKYNTNTLHQSTDQHTPKIEDTT